MCLGALESSHSTGKNTYDLISLFEAVEGQAAKSGRAIPDTLVYQHDFDGA